MGSGNNSLITLLEARYDYLSARAIVKEVVADAGLDADAKSFSDGDIQKFIASVGSLGFDADALSASLGGGGDAADAKGDAAAAKGDAADAKGGDDAADDGAAKKDDEAEEKPKAKAKAKKKKK